MSSTEEWVAYERRIHAQWMAAVPPVPTHVRDLTIAGRRARLYRPPGVPDPAPALLYLHGGGWVLGDIDSYDGAARHLATACSATVISLDYRLAPEHRHPAAPDDTVNAFTIIAAAEHDPLNPQAERLAQRLHTAGVPVRHLPGTGLHHGFLGQLGTHPAADHYLADIGANLGAAWT